MVFGAVRRACLIPGFELGQGRLKVHFPLFRSEMRPLHSFVAFLAALHLRKTALIRSIALTLSLAGALPADAFFA